MIVCGLWELDYARENGYVGKCIMCIHQNGISDNIVNCEKHGKIKEKENCKDWSVDIR